MNSKLTIILALSWFQALTNAGVVDFKIALKNVNKEVSDTMCLDETPINDDAETEIQYPKCEGYGVRID